MVHCHGAHLLVFILHHEKLTCFAVPPPPRVSLQWVQRWSSNANRNEMLAAFAVSGSIRSFCCCA